MKVIFKIEGLDCPVCASELDNELLKIKEIETVKCDFLTQKVTIETKNSVDLDDFFKICLKRVKKFDSDIKLVKE
ncbi:MAG: cation transporter [Clostridia bacterium]|nr:cation transporter [Clostridia bacterium]